MEDSGGLQFELLGWPEDGPTLRLDYRRFSYAGKFVMSTTGKAVVRDPGSGAGTVDRDANADGDDGVATPGSDGTGDRNPCVVDPAVFEEDVLAAAAFNEDRTDAGVLWIRYIDVANTHRGHGLGASLAAFVVDRARERGYRRLRIAVNNPYSYHALYKAGFGYTGRESGMAELVLEYPAERDRPTYQCGLDVFRERDLDAEEHEFLDAKEGFGPPAVVGVPPDAGTELAEAGGDSNPNQDSDAGSGEV